MADLHIINAQLMDPLQGVVGGALLVRDGRIAAIDPSREAITAECDLIDARGALVTPGLVDIHTHGIHSFLYERDPEELLQGALQLPQYGTTCILPTLYKVLDGDSLDHIDRLAVALTESSAVAMPGFHFEGPFLALPGAGARTVPGDLVLLEELIAAARGRVRAMSVSPDCPAILPVIERLCDMGVTVFITHTQASVKQTTAAIDAGARHATHFCNVFPVPAPPEPGVRPVGAFEAVLVDPRCTVDFICDGVHVDPLLIRLALQAKGFHAVSAITDSNIGAGAEDGVYETSWGYSVAVRGDEAVRVADVDHPLHGLLAGSSLTMNRAVANLTKWLGASPAEAIAMASCNPARVVGLQRKGVLQTGADADLVLWKQGPDGYQPQQTWVAGQSVFHALDKQTA